MHHTIDQVKIKVTTTGGMDGIALQHELSRLFWRDLSVKIEQLFDHFSKEHETLVINRLFIDLGNVSQEDWADQFQVKLLEAISKALQKTTATERRKGENISNDHLATASEAVEDPDETIQISGQQHLPARQRLFDVWLFFLKTGILPPAAILPNDEHDWHQAILEMLATETVAELQLLQALSQYREAATRLAMQFEEGFLTRIAAILNLQNLEPLPAYREQLRLYWGALPTGVSKDPEIARWARSLHTHYSQSGFWSAYFLGVASGNPKNIPPEKAVLLPFLQFLQSLAPQQARALKTVLKEHIPAKKSGGTAEKRHFPDMPASAWVETLAKELAADTAPEKQMPGRINTSASVAGPQKAGDNDTSPPTALKALYVQHAGIVLTHAFLPAYFKTLGLLDDKKQFRNAYEQQKAVHVVQFLASGEDRLPEYRLVLPKLLCGLPPESPIEREIRLTDTEKAEAHTLLKSLIEHWNPLGSTSPAGLREGFFNRTGKLSQGQNGLLLQIESRTLDILLQRLPWSISLIKLPWMKEILQVDWNY